MRERLFRVLPLAAVCAALVAIASPARAQLPDQLTFRTGFSFVVGNRVMPAGRYHIERVWDNPFLFEVAGPRNALLEVHYAGHAPATGAGHDEILFRRYENQLVMHEVWDADSSSGVLLAVRHASEREARNDKPEVVVAASRSANGD
jgi:hypothetical protein